MAAYAASASGWGWLCCCALACATKQHARCAALGVADGLVKSSLLRVQPHWAAAPKAGEACQQELTTVSLCQIHRTSPLANRMMRPPSPGTPAAAHPPGAAPSLRQRARRGRHPHYWRRVGE